MINTDWFCFATRVTVRHHEELSYISEDLTGTAITVALAETRRRIALDFVSIQSRHANEIEPSYFLVLHYSKSL